MDIGTSNPPAIGTVQKRVVAVGAEAARPLANTMLFPSGVQPCTLSADACHVRRLGSPPIAGMTKTSVLPPYSPLKAIHFPSGESFGLLSLPTLVNRRAAPPARSTTQMLPAYENAICVALMVGLRNRRVCAPARLRGISTRTADSAAATIRINA